MRGRKTRKGRGGMHHIYTKSGWVMRREEEEEEG